MDAATVVLLMIGIPALIFLIFLYTPAGKRWLKKDQ